MLGGAVDRRRYSAYGTACRQLLESGISLQQLDGIAFGEGPGSFTGLRIACGVAQGLAFAMNIPVVGVSTLKALATQVGNAKVVVALDARMGEIYYAAYEKITDQDWKTVNAPILCAPRNVPNLTGNDWVGCGSGIHPSEAVPSYIRNKVALKESER